MAAVRKFLSSGDGPRRFWNIELKGKRYTVTSGLFFRKGRTQVKEFASTAEAQAGHDKAIRQRLTAGYLEITPRPVSPLQKALEDALEADPDDLTGHMAYADYLMEQLEDTGCEEQSKSCPPEPADGHLPDRRQRDPSLLTAPGHTINLSGTKHPPPRGTFVPTDGSVTRWIDQLPLGDPEAVRGLWERYFRRLVGLARKKLADAPHGMADEEDVALSAFDSFCRNARQGRFPDLADRDGLWRILVVMTARKAGHLRRDETRLKRGGGKGTAEGDERGDRPLEEALSREPDPATAALAADEHRRLMDTLGDDDLRRVAQRRMEGDSVEEIAALLGYAPRSIKRKLRLIRETWERELDA